MWFSASAIASGSENPSGATPSSSARRTAITPGREARGRSSRDSPAPNVSSATRPARRTASRAITVATPSATSDLSRWAVPNAIEGDTSTTSHVVRVRSGTWSLTYGSPVRAVAAASMWRTSSPGSYGRS
jgi:hypothetical protein